MNRTAIVASILCASIATAPVARACGEGQFNMGQGMRYQGYLAPRPAAVLVYVDPAADANDRAQINKGLEQAGHKVTLVSDPNALAAAMDGKHFDVVIVDLAQADAVKALADASNTRLVPVVARRERNSPAVRSRFPLHLFSGASLGQYLKAINQAVAPSP